MARIAKSKPAADKAAPAAAKPAKGKAAKPAADKAAPADKADRKPRGAYAHGKLRVTPAGKAATLRGGRQVRLDLVRSLDGKPMSEVLGAAYRLDGEAADRTLNSSNIAVFADKGFVEIV